jgi:hypothetical protein
LIKRVSANWFDTEKSERSASAFVNLQKGNWTKRGNAPN